MENTLSRSGAHVKDLLDLLEDAEEQTNSATSSKLSSRTGTDRHHDADAVKLSGGFPRTNVGHADQDSQERLVDPQQLQKSQLTSAGQEHNEDSNAAESVDHDKTHEAEQSSASMDPISLGPMKLRREGAFKRKAPKPPAERPATEAQLGNSS
ncbi:hypothetical protein BIW11_14319 [Tropilaelaps mercedesae]|uniref:Uncharacterized protein n=1 Tax=Tropilaelaps mercedesae TaxID=418985 RepID=A0A1V9WY69_9ACAR|nr:hypothetical protein BIW11_14319 [Tropilaelaps mercedesae]